MKFALLALRKATRKWTMPIKNWGIILNQSMTKVENWVQP